MTARRGGRARRTRRRMPALVIVAVSVGVVMFGGLVWIVASDQGGDAPNVVDEPGVSHVHGLGINPADDSLIVATHFGSFRLPADGGEAERIGDSYQDTMGFTVAGPDNFLGSGHPDVAGMRAGQPTRLGLIESRDAGDTWMILSLGDEVDFHALAFAHDQVYGWDSRTGRLMVSADRREWETLATLDLYGFVVDPADADHLVGASPDGLLESTNGGRAWTAVDGPPLVTVSWDRDAGLWGVEANGVVWRRVGSDWDEAGRLPGEPQAFVATAEVLYAAVHDEDERTAIYESTDDGRTWDVRYRDPAQ